MKEKLIEKLWDYIIENNPELMFSLQEDYSVRKYLDHKIGTLNDQLEQWQEQGLPNETLEELALQELTKDLKPSRFHYVRSILEEEFKPGFLRFKEAGTLTYQVVTIIDSCKEAFEAIGFSEQNKNSKRLRDIITGIITKHLESK
ncbi:DUF1896 family protein [Sinomicrobium weinanense]|uniref:DUF1896 family protein n=1 Tax=Sinomicrobium weinanense TaxID=2842200 RepID=A0A926JQC6_9FLAO|nr:DUF1896 family protein [Sinomicrobium weinanense]MBC9795363.1 DUF1896 family protein [Sinomicrobium weinanense]MBU3122922.1 DUF1896 domain-containing protein [Sinomicrobium weinanense]